MKVMNLLLIIKTIGKVIEKGIFFNKSIEISLLLEKLENYEYYSDYSKKKLIYISTEKHKEGAK